MTIGILGGGQLGRMLALAAYPLNILTRVYEPAEESSAAQVAPRTRGEYDDFRVLFEFLRGLDAVTYEFENVPLETAHWLAERIPVFPPPEALRVSQDRIAEKTFFQEAGVPVPEFAAVETETEFRTALAKIGLPAVLKTTRFGYDGKGQAFLKNDVDVVAAWSRLSGRALILEKAIPFEREVSQISVRSRSGAIVHYPLVENVHRDGMLRQSLAPAPDAGTLTAQAQAIAQNVMLRLNYVGTLAIEFFVLDGRLLVNEMAPRVHNSGHWSIEGAACSQFENHMRALAGLPLGETTMICPAAGIVNAIGTMPPARDILPIPGVHWHHYGKAERPNRKVGHISIRGCDHNEVLKKMMQISEIDQG
jgi:5-(carboxyamino)imidazole ribonucleotide synthase